MDSLDLTYCVIGASMMLAASFFIFIFRKNKKDSLHEKKPSQPPEQTASIKKPDPQLNETKTENLIQQIAIKTLEELQSEYPALYYNSFRVKSQKSIHNATAIAFSGSKLLYGDSKNQLILVDLKNLKKDNKDEGHSVTHKQQQQKYFVSLDNNTASAVAIGTQYYYAALSFDKTIVYFEFMGGVNGVYFKQICRFPRNVLKSDAGSIWVPEHEKYIVTTGTGADTVIDVWSMKGQKLGHVNTYQITQYQASFGHRDVLIRGWTSEAKLFSLFEEKDGVFKKIDKKMPVALDESPQYCAIDNYSMYAVSISKKHHLRLWPLYSSFLLQSHTQKYLHDDSLQKIVPGLNKCAIFSQQVLDGHFKSIIVVASDNKFVLLNNQLQVLKQVEGVQCMQLYVTGKKKNAILGIVGKSGRITFWNLTDEICRCPQVKL